MRGTRFPGVDLTVYGAAVLHLVRNPALIVVPLLMLIVGVLIRHLLVPFGGGMAGSLTVGLAGFIMMILALFGFGSACILADDVWRRGRGSFDQAWTQTQHRAGDLLTSAVGVTMILTLALYVSQLLSATIGLVLAALATYFMIFALPAAAVGGAPGGLSVQLSIDRVRSAPLAAAIATVVTLVLVFYAAPTLAVLAGGAAAAWVYGGTLALDLLLALFQSIAAAYAALVLTKVFTDLSFTRRY